MEQATVSAGAGRAPRKPYQRVLLVIIILLVIVGVIYLLRNTAAGKNLWVMLSSAYAAFLILLRKLKGFFLGGEPDSIAELQDRLDEVDRVEKELIDTLMKERQVFKDRLARLEGEGAQIDAQIAAQQAVLENYSDAERWEANVWQQMSPEAKEALTRDAVGRQGSLEDFYYDM
ncbi:MAG: hypothetical protein KDH97_04130 [Calditrichaeota bacterium]|nr:hypothetical protein [Calditrichota bacterium]